MENNCLYAEAKINDQQRYIHFYVPTQVLFWDYDGDKWVGGIAYGDEIICGCCGGVFELSEIYEFAPPDVEHPVRVYNSWVDLSDEIYGGEEPDDFNEGEED